MVFDHSQRTTEEQARKNRDRDNNGKISQVEDTPPLDDDWDVNIGLAGSGVVHGIARPYCSTGGTRQCCNRCFGWCLCSLAQPREKLNASKAG